MTSEGDMGTAVSLRVVSIGTGENTEDCFGATGTLMLTMEPLAKLTDVVWNGFVLGISLVNGEQRT
jgi:purine-cytosine permease-like protein